MDYIAHPAPLSFTISWSLLSFMSIELVMVSNYLILCHPLLLLPSIFPSFRVFSNEPVLPIRWPKYRSFSFSISPSNEYSGLISFRIDWCDLLAVQGTHKSLLQHRSSKASILWSSAFFMVQLWHPYMTTGKSIALTIQTFIGKAAYEDINLRITCTLVCSSTVHSIGRTTSYLITGKFLNLSLLPFLHLSKDRKIALPLAVWEW